jgi:hypothetical protein
VPVFVGFGSGYFREGLFRLFGQSQMSGFAFHGTPPGLFENRPHDSLLARTATAVAARVSDTRCLFCGLPVSRAPKLRATRHLRTESQSQRG